MTLLLTQEGQGAVVDDPNDTGGLTRWGISQKAFPNVNVAALTRDEAARLYHDNYWVGDNLADQRLANLLLSMCVNMGKASAIRLLQKGLGITQDGTWGPMTEHYCNSDPGLATTEFAAQCVKHYCDIAYVSPKQQLYLLGWIRRVVECLVT